MDLATAEDVLLIVVIVGARLLVPQLLFVCPLPAIIAALVLDGIDQTVLHNGLSPDKWSSIENSYQGYDKALDVYYLALAYLATLRNWENLFAIEVSRFLWYYRLVGVAVFEILHDSSSPDSWRWLLLVFPNVFEYFFIAYEAIRLRWDPRRLSPRFVLGLAGFLWVVVKLPQEWWIHVAKLDFTDFADEHAWVYPTIAMLLVAAGAGWWWATSRSLLPPRDHGAQLLVRGPTAPRNQARALLGWPLFEKVVLTGLLCVAFAEVLPRSNARPSQVMLAVAVFVMLDSAVSEVLSARIRQSWTVAATIVGLVAVNLAVVETFHLLTSRFRVEHALFYAFLLALIVAWYDACRPSYDRRLAAPQAVSPPVLEPGPAGGSTPPA
jgi:hypothetical protein